MSDDLDRMEEIARGATEDGLADGILAYETNLDRFASTFDPHAVLSLISRLRKAEAERDAAYVEMIDTAGFLRGCGPYAEIAADQLARSVPEDFADREEAARQALQPLKEPT